MPPELSNLAGRAAEVEPLMLLAAVIAIVFGLAVIIVNVKLVLDIAPYAYPNAKIRSMQSMLLGKRKLEEFAELDLLNISGALEETEYTETYRALSKNDDILSIESTLNRNLRETYVKIAGFVPGDAKTFFERYLKRFEIEAIKTLLIGVYAGLPPEEIEKMLVEPYAENLKETTLSSNVPEVVSKLEGSDYGVTLSRTLPDFESSGSLLSLQHALDVKLYLDLIEVLITRPSLDSSVIKKLLGAEIDITNIKMVLRCARYGGDVSSYLIPYGHEISTARLAEMGSSADVERIVNDLEGTPYHRPLYEALEKYMEDKGRSLQVFEMALDRYYLSLGQSIATKQPFGLGPILGYVVTKSFEIRNLTTIFVLKMEGFSPEEIKKEMV
ncbi:MAG: ATP synthase A1 subunit C [Candidatus Hydrothermarchaeaceae archaeon]